MKTFFYNITCGLSHFWLMTKERLGFLSLDEQDKLDKRRLFCVVVFGSARLR